jgi:hypothetical protein
MCSNCHRESGSLVDFTNAGYPEHRRRALVNPMMSQMIDHIREGRIMHLPDFISPARSPESREEPPRP